MFAPYNTRTYNDPTPLWFRANFAKQQQKATENAIFAAFGRFIAAYALAEAGVHMAMRSLSGIPDEKARVIFGGMRLIDIEKRLRYFAGHRLSEVETLLKQLEAIGEARDQFVHRLVEYKHGAGLVVTNRLTSRQGGEAQIETFTASGLEDMAHDCRVIFARFVLMCESWDDLGLVDESAALLGQFEPWRYTRARPNQHMKQTPRQRKGFPRQHRASQKSQPGRK